MLINLVIIAFPLAATLEPRISYYRKLPAVFVSMLVVGAIFVAWDYAATLRGDWAFNESYVFGAKIIGLPLEELLFFVTVPYSCLFIYESVLAFLKERRVPFSRGAYLGISLALMALAVSALDRAYTSAALFSASLALAILSIIGQGLLSSASFWRYMLLCFGMFLIFNYALTSLPIVVYNPHAISGLRVLTIPVEDFLFNFSMLSMHLLVYERARSFFGARRANPEAQKKQRRRASS